MTSQSGLGLQGFSGLGLEGFEVQDCPDLLIANTPMLAIPAPSPAVPSTTTTTAAAATTSSLLLQLAQRQHVAPALVSKAAMHQTSLSKTGPHNYTSFVCPEP